MFDQLRYTTEHIAAVGPVVVAHDTHHGDDEVFARQELAEIRC